MRSDSRTTFAACWAHARRKIDECRSAFPIQVAKLESLIRMLDVHAYLEDVLRRALAGETDWDTMAPHAWKAEHPESVRQYRQDERRQAADRKRVRRARRRLTKS